MSFPNKEERSLCWGARDKYWECLDKNNSKEVVKDGPCAEFRKFYEKSCSAQWVKHFDRKWSYLQYKNKIENEGIPTLPDREKGQSKQFVKRRIYAEIAI